MKTPPRSLLRGLGAPLYLAAVAWLALTLGAPPEPKPADAPPEEFSALRALEHLETIAREPHPIGSPRNAEVRDYLVRELEALGLEVEVQRTPLVYDYGRRPNVTRMATVENVVARRPGRGNGPAVVLMSHYDSVPSSPGATDDGAGVAIVLETLRALSHRGPLKNDVLAVINDGEEAGLLGAQAFFRQHRWAERTGVVLNFEARGSAGPVFMFETSAGNAGLVAALAEAAPHPAADSLSYEIYRRMPNDTDLSIAKAEGKAGLNFSSLDNFFDYHTMGDSASNVDLRTLQHGGSYALALASHLGDVDLPLAASADATYWNVLGHVLVRYPAWVVYPVAGLALVLAVAVFVIGRRRKLLSFRDVALGLLAFVLQLVLVFVVVTAAFRAVGGGTDNTVSHWAFFYQHKTQLLAFVLLTVGVSFAYTRGLERGLRTWEIGAGAGGVLVLLAVGGVLVSIQAAVVLVVALLLFGLYRKPRPVWGLHAGSLVAWLLLLGVVTTTMPGGSYLFAWPLIAALAALAWTLRRGDAGVGAVLVGALPGAFWLATLSYYVYLALGVGAPGAAMVVPALALGLLVPAAAASAEASRGIVPALLVVAAAVLLVKVAVTSPFDERHMLPNELFYVADADSGETYWASGDEAPDVFTRELLGDDPEATTFGDVLPGAKAAMWKAPAPPAAIPPPEVEILTDETSEGKRTLRFHLRSPRGAEVTNLFFDESAAISAATIDGQPVTVASGQGTWRWRYFALPPEGTEIELEAGAEAPIVLTVVDVAYRFPEALAADVPERPPHMMQKPYSLSDSTVVKRTFTFSSLEIARENPATPPRASDRSAR